MVSVQQGPIPDAPMASDRPLEDYKPLPESGFDRFLRFLIDEAPSFVSEMYASYATPQVAYVGKFENLVTDVATALEMAGEPVDRGMLEAVAPVNVSSTSNSALIWPQDLRRK